MRNPSRMIRGESERVKRAAAAAATPRGKKTTEGFGGC